MITAVIEATAVAPDLFFERLSQALAEAVGASTCFVTECDLGPVKAGDKPNLSGVEARTLSFWHRGRHIDNMVYPVAKTPCEHVFRDGSLCYGQGIQQLFPEDADLVDLGVESYAAAPMIDTRGNVIGHLAILDERPFQDGDINLAILRLLATVAAAELSKRRAARLAAERERLLRQIIDLLPHPVFAKDEEGRFWLANHAAAKGLGTTRDRLLGNRDEDFLSAELVERFRAEDAEVLRSGDRLNVDEIEYLDNHGERQWVSTSKVPIDIDSTGRRAVLGVAINVTDQVRAERRLRSLVEATAATFGHDFFSSLVARLSEMLGVRWALVGEVDDDRIRCLALSANGELAEPLHFDFQGTPCAEVIATGAQFEVRQAVGQRYRHLPGASELGTESYLGTPLISADGEVGGILAILHDRPKVISAQDRSLVELFAARASAELRRQRAENRQRELQSQVLFVQKLESLGVLAGGIAHDFNNLLATILGNVGLALMQVKESDELRLYLQEIELAAERSAELTRQMLAYSGKGLESKSQPVDIAVIVDEMVELLRSSVSKKARLRFELAESLPAIDADPVQIRQLVLNLITNAAEALQGQSGDVTLRALVTDPPDGLLETGTQNPLRGRCVCLEVEDTGCGIDDETRQRLFDPFYSTKRSGRGLGMATVHGVVRKHRAAIEIDSVVGQGTRMAVWFPSTESEAETASREPTQHEQGECRTGTILVVDDEASVRRTAAKILQHRGYRVVEAADGLEALHVFKRRRDIDIVLLDLTMPELDGFETLAELRKLESDIKVILCSGYSSRDATSIDVDGFLAKPYRPAELLNMIDPLLPEHLRPVV
ncbi:MAG: response regulator [Acidobacteriota bacterium]